MSWDNWAPVKIATTASLIAGTVLGAYLYVDDRHAHADEFQELKQYTIYSIKEVELESTMARLEIMLNIPIVERRPWQIREIGRLENRVEHLQLKLGYPHKE